MGYRRKTPSRAEIAFGIQAFSPVHLPQYVVDPPPSNARSNRSWRRGMDAEKQARATLHREGYDIHRSHMSQGDEDLIGMRRADVADGPIVRRVQVKRLAVFAATGLNDAIVRFLGLGRFWSAAKQAQLRADYDRREAWLWVDRQGWTARVAITTAGDVVALDGARVEEVVNSITKRLDDERRKAKTRSERSLPLRERLLR